MNEANDLTMKVEGFHRPSQINGELKGFYEDRVSELVS